jgi:hypothetical protein
MGDQKSLTRRLSSSSMDVHIDELSDNGDPGHLGDIDAPPSDVLLRSKRRRAFRGGGTKRVRFTPCNGSVDPNDMFEPLDLKSRHTFMSMLSPRPDTIQQEGWGELSQHARKRRTTNRSPPNITDAMEQKRSSGVVYQCSREEFCARGVLKDRDKKTRRFSPFVHPKRGTTRVYADAQAIGIRQLQAALLFEKDGGGNTLRGRGVDLSTIQMPDLSRTTIFNLSDILVPDMKRCVEECGMQMVLQTPKSTTPLPQSKWLPEPNSMHGDIWHIDDLHGHLQVFTPSYVAAKNSDLLQADKIRSRSMTGREPETQPEPRDGDFSRQASEMCRMLEQSVRDENARILRMRRNGENNTDGDVDMSGVDAVFSKDSEEGMASLLGAMSKMGFKSVHELALEME